MVWDGGKRVRLGIAAIVTVAAIVAAFAAAEQVSSRRAVAGVSRSAAASAILLAASFRRELDKFRLVPIVLADDAEARAALASGDPARLAALNPKLEALSRETRAANVYLLDARGVAVVASNWRRRGSFLGDDYGYRSYFRTAWREGAAEQFALGQRSKRPGLYISRRLIDRGRPVGVVVVKVDFDALEREWRAIGTPAFATDGRDIMLVSSNPAWRFQTVGRLGDVDRARARRSLEYGAVPLVQNALFANDRVAPAFSAAAGSRPYVAASAAVEDGWRVHVLAPVDAAVAAARATVRLGFAITLLTAIALFLVWRQRRRAATARQEATTAARLAAMNDQLEQANKLAVLGQITAGVGHEMAQPVAAIAAHAHAARALIDRDRAVDAIGPIRRIEEMTQRIGVITRELRGFARRASGDMEAVPVAEVVAGVALLLRHRLDALGATIVGEGAAVTVRAERVRLEQVLMNLVQNALDAGGRRISITATPTGDRVRIAVADDGPGVSAAARAMLFQPFRTTKADGLGLGLVISHDIVAGMGGSLEAGAPATGAEFVIELEVAR